MAARRAGSHLVGPAPWRSLHAAHSSGRWARARRWPPRHAAMRAPHPRSSVPRTSAARGRRPRLRACTRRPRCWVGAAAARVAVFFQLLGMPSAPGSCCVSHKPAACHTPLAYKPANLDAWYSSSRLSRTSGPVSCPCSAAGRGTAAGHALRGPGQVAHPPLPPAGRCRQGPGGPQGCAGGAPVPRGAALHATVVLVTWQYWGCLQVVVHGPWRQVDATQA